eukprot:258421_1
MAMISDIYSDSDEDCDMNEHTDSIKNQEQVKQTSKSKALPKPFGPMPPRQVSWKKKRSYGSYTSHCKNDNRGPTIAGPNNQNYNIQTMPIKKRRELINSTMSNPTGTIYNDAIYSPIKAKKGDKHSQNQANNHWNNNNSNTNSSNTNNTSSLKFKPRQIKANTTNVSTEDLGNMWSKSSAKQFARNKTTT